MFPWPLRCLEGWETVTLWVDMISGQWRMTRYCTRMLRMMYQPVNENISFFKAGPLSDCWCMWEANKWWRLVEVGEITEEYPVMLPLSNPRPLHVHQPVFFMSSKTGYGSLNAHGSNISLVQTLIFILLFLPPDEKEHFGRSSSSSSICLLSRMRV